MDADQSRANRHGKQVLAAFHQYGLGQVLYMGTDNTWRWRRNAGDQFYPLLWGQIAQKLGLHHLLGGSKRTQLTVDRQNYTTGERVTVYARLYASDFSPVKEQIVAAGYTVRVAGAPGPVREVPLRAVPEQPGMYRGDFVALEPGAHQFSVKSDPATVLEFNVAEPKFETGETAMNEVLLKQMAEASGGAYFREETLAQFPKAISAKAERIQGTLDGELWSSPIACSDRDRAPGRAHAGDSRRAAGGVRHDDLGLLHDRGGLRRLGAGKPGVAADLHRQYSRVGADARISVADASQTRTTAEAGIGGNRRLGCRRFPVHLRARGRIFAAGVPFEEHHRHDDVEDDPARDPHDERAEQLILERRDGQHPRRGSVGRIENVVRHRDVDRDNRHRDAHQKAVQQLSRISEPRKFGDLTQKGPPHQHRGNHEHQVLGDVNVVVRHRRVVERRQMPRGDDEIEDDERYRSAREKTRRRRDEAIREYWPKHPSGHAGEQERRHCEGEQEMLHHVRAEEVVVTQVVNWTIE